MGTGMTTPASGDSSPSLGEVSRMRALIGEVGAALQSQQELLRIRQMALMPELFQLLSAVDQDLNRLEAILTDEQTELEQLNVLIQTSAMVNSSLDLSDILGKAMDEILNLTGAGRGYIFLLDEESGELQIHIARVLEPDDSGDEDDDESAHVSRTILTHVSETMTPMLTDNAQTDPRMIGSETIAKFMLRSVMCAPLVYKTRLIGAIYLDNRFREGVFTDRELNLLTAFANQTAVAIENALLFSSVQTALEEIITLKELIENVFGSIPSGVITANADDVVTSVNAAAGRILNRQLEESIGYPIDHVIPRVSVEQYLENVRLNNASVNVETQPDIPDRGRIALAMRLSPLKNAEQELQGVAMVIDDVTEQRERDELLTLMTRYLPPGLVAQIDVISALALGGERREVTCAFIEAIPYGVLAAELRPQQAMNTLNVFLETATQVINDARGIIDKYMGSEVMVLFNTQLNPMPDHALAALRMALELREAFLGLYQRLGIAPDPHYYRMGINSGVATLGNVGSLNRRSFTAIGDTINLSKRLEENAQSGQIIISEGVCRAIGVTPDGVRFEEKPPILVKGKALPIQIFEVFKA